MLHLTEVDVSSLVALQNLLDRAPVESGCGTHQVVEDDAASEDIRAFSNSVLKELRRQIPGGPGDVSRAAVEPFHVAWLREAEVD
jgi:hypothetical protein